MLDDQDFINHVAQRCKERPALRMRLLEALRQAGAAPANSPVAEGTQQFSAETVSSAYGDADSILG